MAKYRRIWLKGGSERRGTVKRRLDRDLGSHKSGYRRPELPPPKPAKLPAAPERRHWTCMRCMGMTLGDENCKHCHYPRWLPEAGSGR